MAEVNPEGLQRVYNDFMGDPEIAPEFLKLYKRKYPNARVPELEAIERTEKTFAPKIDEQSKKIKELEEQILKDRISREIENKRDRLRQAPYHFSDSELDEVEKIVAEEGTTYDNAAQLYAWRTDARAGGGPSGYVPRPAQRQQPDWKKELRNPESRLFKDTDNYLNELWTEARKDTGPLRVNQSY